MEGTVAIPSYPWQRSIVASLLSAGVVSCMVAALVLFQRQAWWVLIAVCLLAAYGFGFASARELRKIGAAIRRAAAIEPPATPALRSKRAIAGWSVACTLVMTLGMFGFSLLLLYGIPDLRPSTDGASTIGLLLLICLGFGVIFGSIVYGLSLRRSASLGTD